MNDGVLHDDGVLCCATSPISRTTIAFVQSVRRLYPKHSHVHTYTTPSCLSSYGPLVTWPSGHWGSTSNTIEWVEGIGLQSWPIPQSQLGIDLSAIYFCHVISSSRKKQKRSGINGWAKMNDGVVCCATTTFRGRHRFRTVCTSTIPKA